MRHDSKEGAHMPGRSLYAANITRTCLLLFLRGTISSLGGCLCRRSSRFCHGTWGGTHRLRLRWASRLCGMSALRLLLLSCTVLPVLVSLLSLQIVNGRQLEELCVPSPCCRPDEDFEVTILANLILKFRTAKTQREL